MHGPPPRQAAAAPLISVKPLWADRALFSQSQGITHQGRSPSMSASAAVNSSEG